MVYRLDIKFTAFLFSHGFLRRDFTDRYEIWHEASPISQMGLLKFDGKIVAFFLFRILHGGICILLTPLLFIAMSELLKTSETVITIW